jgi:hypothetical protein
MTADCSSEFIKAHSVPKSSLKKIARDGRVYSFIPDPINIKKQDGILQPNLVGIKDASIFTGFCSVHDNELFAKVEDQTFIASPEQCFLLAYRAQARELFMKKAQLEFLGTLRKVDRGKNIAEQHAIQEFIKQFSTGVSMGLSDSYWNAPRFNWRAR